MKLCRYLAGALAACLLNAPARAANAPILPAFPQLPAPTGLTETRAGEIYFDTRTPCDFDIPHHCAARPRHSGTGRLAPPPAGAEHRAMVSLPGSGGISPGREMEYAALPAANGYAALMIDYCRRRSIIAATLADREQLFCGA
jgi:hypothetical protein